MTPVNNYIESNWKFDCGLILLIIVSTIFAYKSESLIGFIGVIFIGLIFFVKIFFTLKNINREIKRQLKSKYENAQAKNQINYYGLGIKLIEDSNTLDILYNNSIIKSIKKIENTDNSIVTTKNSIWNWNWRGRGNDNYYQIFIESKDKFHEILRFKELTWEGANKDFNLAEFENLANEIAYKLKIKIKPAHNNSYR